MGVKPRNPSPSWVGHCICLPTTTNCRLTKLSIKSTHHKMYMPTLIHGGTSVNLSLWFICNFEKTLTGVSDSSDNNLPGSDVISVDYVLTQLCSLHFRFGATTISGSDISRLLDEIANIFVHYTTAANAK